MTSPGASSTVAATVRSAIRRLRHARKMTGAQLAAEVTRHGHPLTRSTLAKIETGERLDITVDELVGIAAALDVSPMDLLTEDQARSAMRARAMSLRAEAERLEMEADADHGQNPQATGQYGY